MKEINKEKMLLKYNSGGMSGMNEIEKVFDKYNLTGTKRKKIMRDIKKVIFNILSCLHYDTYNCKLKMRDFRKEIEIQIEKLKLEGK